MLLPSKAVVRDGLPGIVIEAMEPKVAISLIPDETVQRLGAEASERLNRVIASLKIQADELTLDQNGFVKN